ncbi:hypothetical protein ACVWXM_001586 [Bradyrhizobium sp. GM7.3]
MTEPLINMDDRLERFLDITLEHPRLGAIRTRVHWLMRQTETLLKKNEARRLAARGRPIKSEELWLLPLIGPSGATKTTSIRKVTDEIFADPKYPEKDVPVLVVTMRGIKNTRDFISRVLDVYEDAGADDIPIGKKINERRVALAIYEIARKKRTSLLIIDEAHEMLRHDGGKVGTHMASLLKTMVNECVFSILLIGTDELQPLYVSVEAHSRSVPDEDVQLAAFDIAKEKDRDYFFPFLKLLEERMVQDGVVDRPLGWVDCIEDCARIYDMSGGVLGTPCRVVYLALERAFRAGRPYLEWEDIEKAFRSLNRLRANPGYDPFAEGPRKGTMATLKDALR